MLKETQGQKKPTSQTGSQKIEHHDLKGIDERPLGKEVKIREYRRWAWSPLNSETIRISTIKKTLLSFKETRGP